MSSRFHQKYHRPNHHSVVPGTNNSNLYPDAGFDPIASFDSPFQGEFFSNGDIITTKGLSAGEGLYIGGEVSFQGTTRMSELSVSANAHIDGSLTVGGDFLVQGETTVLETTVVATSAIEITNTGTGPALKVTQAGITPLAWFIDAEGSSVVIDNNSYVGIGTETPEADLHIQRPSGQPAAIKVEGDSPTFTLENLTGRFDINHSETGATVFSTTSQGTVLKELYKIKLADNSDVVTILSGGEIGINTIGPNKEFTVNGEISSTNTVTVPHVVVTNPHIHVTFPTSNVNLPTSAIDIEFNTTLAAMITSFSGGTRGLLYTLTNIGAELVTLSAALSNPRIYIRNGTAWKSNSYSLSTAFLQLPPKTSCSLRVAGNGIVSVW